MTYTDCPNHPPGHVWDNGLSCRWCDATRTPEEAILSGLASRRGGTRDSARTLLDAYRIGVLLAAGVQYVDCPVCGAAQPVAGECGNCAFQARMAAELAARGLTNPEAGGAG